MEDRFVLEIPSSPEYVGTARIFVGAVVRQLGTGEEGIDDLKLAVSELCSAGAREGGGPIRVVLASDGGPVTVEVELPAVVAEGLDDEATPDSFARSVGLDVVRSLYPDVEREDVEDRSRIRFRFPSDG